MTISSVKRGLIDDSMLLGLPGAMAAPVATDAGTGTTVSIAFTAVTGATSYSVVSSPATTTQTASSSPYTFTGLTAGTAYTFTIAATNAVGQGGFSQASNSVTPINPTVTSVEFVVVAGGGGSSSSGGGGGGYRSSVVGEMSGGGASAESVFAITTGTTYTVTIGAGGAGNGSGVGVASNGGNSVFGSITSLGGGGGGGQSNGATGGSGGGAHTNGSGSSGTQGGSGTTGQGYKGANATGSYQQSGGGGAGAAGTNTSGTQYPSAPGVGTAITGSTTYYAGGGNILRPTSWNRAGAGNLEGDGTDGVTNTGGGAACYAGASGGSGIVIIRYPNTKNNAASTTGSPTFTNTGGYKIYKWTGSGSITF